MTKQYNTIMLSSVDEKALHNMARLQSQAVYEELNQDYYITSRNDDNIYKIPRHLYIKIKGDMVDHTLADDHVCILCTIRRHKLGLERPTQKMMPLTDMFGEKRFLCTGCGKSRDYDKDTEAMRKAESQKNKYWKPDFTIRRKY